MCDKTKRSMVSVVCCWAFFFCLAAAGTPMALATPPIQAPQDPAPGWEAVPPLYGSTSKPGAVRWRRDADEQQCRARECPCFHASPVGVGFMANRMSEGIARRFSCWYLFRSAFPRCKP